VEIAREISKNHYWEMGMGVLEALRAGFGLQAAESQLEMGYGVSVDELTG
jgi:hypothetical protein